MKIFKKSCLFGTIYHIFLFLFSLLCGYLVTMLLDRGMEGDMWGALRLSAYFMVIFLLGLPVIYFGRRKLGQVLRTERQLFREKLYLDMIKRRIKVDSVGEMNVRFSNDADTVAEYFQTAVPSMVEGAGIMISVIILLCHTHLILGLLFFGLSLLQLLPSVVYEKWAKEIYEQTDDAEENYDSWLIQGCEGLTALKAHSREEWFAKKLSEISDGMVTVGVRAERTGAVETIVFQFVDGVLCYGSYVIIGLFVLYGGLAVSDTPVLIVLGSFLFRSVENLLAGLKKRFEFQVANGHLAEVGFQHRMEFTEKENLLETNREKFPVLEVSSLCKKFGDKNIFSDISFSVYKGERVLVCGANGSGKSTLLRVILGLLPADGGSIIVDLNNVSFALQEEADLELSGNEVAKDLLEENMLEQDSFKKYLDGFQITQEIMEKPLREWSMGERKKFFLAAAFARGGELLLLDEPTNHLDVEALEYLCDRIVDYQGTVLAVSHKADFLVKWQQVIALEQDAPA
ncbi:MAG: ATP-binding cassette domain-containing protein [Lachnospiraceae bacterium]|nr:ATP-binding cassette domain-containing protein [Lachnospiraceae bacterium]